MKRVISLVLVLCMMFSFAACGDDRVEETNSIDATESTTTTTRAAAITTRPSQKVITVDEVKDHIESYFRSLGSSGSSAGIVDKGTEKKGGKDVCSFAFNNNNVGVVVHTVGGNVEQIISVAAVSAFKIGGFSAAEAVSLATTFALLPSSICYKEKDIRSLIIKIMESKKELLDDGSIAYSYKEGECFYTLIISETLITAAVKREADADAGADNGLANDISKEGLCVNGHVWKNITESVYHKEAGHYENVVVDQEMVEKYHCASTDCENSPWYYSYEDVNEHYKAVHGYAVSYDEMIHMTHTAYDEKPIYEKQWIVDAAPYYETVIKGRKCSVCGKTE